MLLYLSANCMRGIFEGKQHGQKTQAVLRERAGRHTPQGEAAYQELQRKPGRVSPRQRPLPERDGVPRRLLPVRVLGHADLRPA